MSIFDKLRILAVLNKTFNDLSKETSMKFSWNVVLQILGTVVQGANAMTSLLPTGAKEIVAIGVGIAQGVIALIAHFTNPDGTSASTAYVPKN